MFKKIVATAAIAVAIVAVSAPIVEAQVAYGTMCCDINPYTGLPRYRCAIVNATPVGNPCQCLGIAGTGFVCQ